MPPHIAVIDAGFTESKPNFYTADSESHVPIPPSHKWNSAYPTQAQIKRRSIVLGGMAISSGPLYAKRQSNLLAKTMRVNVSPTTMEPSMESSMALLPPQAFAGILKSSISSPVSVRGQLSTLFENLGGKNSKGKRINIVVDTFLASNIFGQEICVSLIPEWLLNRIFCHDLSGNATAATVIFTDFPIVNSGLFGQIRAGNLAGCAGISSPLKKTTCRSTAVHQMCQRVALDVKSSFLASVSVVLPVGQQSQIRDLDVETSQTGSAMSCGFRMTVLVNMRGTTI
ncbi:conserved hypothetical protein [Histoplasma capsulatum var. duboisii H88]|uniref:Uncharacterized protein n=1 Tax=Ajellomyces capsulatus (strain H88) TaxID=544711 RepID=F0UW82_AJEC8|nr:conserved hypothetical protein [Histoplasma capsulatum var. duboisii H88]